MNKYPNLMNGKNNDKQGPSNWCSALDVSSPCCRILNSISDGVCIIDFDRRITSFFNKAAEKITGFNEKEAIGKHCYDGSIMR